jgi:copper chaperone CopZ
MLVLWLGAAVVVLFAGSPYYSGTLWSTVGPRFQTVTAGTTESNSLAVLTVDDLNCGGCVAAIQRTLSRLDGIRDVKFNYSDNSARILFDGNRVTAQQIEAKVKAAGVNVLALRTTGI